MSSATLDQASATPASPSDAASPPAGPVVGYAGRRTSRPQPRVNVRLIVFLTIVAVPFVGIFYLFISQLMSGGITRHSGYTEVELKALGNFPFNQANGTREDIPARWRELDGQKVQLQGFMFAPLNAGTKGTEFQFVYNVSKCCFGGPPQVQERVYGHVPKGQDVPIYDQNQFVRMTGILHTRVIRDEVGAIHSVFDMDVQKAVAVDE